MWKNNRFIITIHNIKGSSHQDFRFEVPFNNKLISFAIPKGIPLNQKDGKVMAIRTPNHMKWFLDPPKTITTRRGHSTYEIYDKGTLDILRYNNYAITLRFNGKVVTGYYTIIKINKKKKEWLIFKNKYQGKQK